MRFDQRCQEMGAEIINTKTKNHLYGYDCITKTLGFTNTIMDIIGLTVFFLCFSPSYDPDYFSVKVSSCNDGELLSSPIQGPRWEVSSETTRCILT